MQTRINKYPYFLWLNKNIEIEFKNEKKVIYEGKETELKKVSMYEILIFKHLPVFIILVFTFQLPEFKYIIPGLIFFGILFLVLIKFAQHIQKVLFIFMLIGWYLVWNDYALDIEQIMYITFEFGLIGFLYYDINNLFKRDQYYYLSDISTQLVGTGIKEIPTVKEFLTFGLWKSKNKKREIKTHLRASINGFYIKLPKDL